MAIDAERAACPEAEELAAYVEHTLPVANRPVVEAHLLECADCRHVVVETAAWRQSSHRQTMASMFRTHWLRIGAFAAAAALVIFAIRVSWPPQRGVTTPVALQDLVAAVGADSTRPIDGRLTGGFPYAPPPSALRAVQPIETGSPRVQVAVAAIERDARANPSPQREAALGVAYLVSGDLDASIAALERAAAGQSGNARFWSDLSAAYIQRGLRTGGRDDYENARRAADRALMLEPGLREAAFNLAAALEHMGDTQAAVAAWRTVGRVDPASAWAAESERRARALATAP
jgi:tetratricopeptide (TPR) repeat protein